jgi:hypothetical protein
LPGSVAAQSDGLPHAPQGRREPHVEPVDPFVASAEAPAEPPRRPAPAETGFHAAATESAARGAGEGFRPLLKPARAPDAVAGAAGASRELPGQRHAARAVQQPDDIQIHIGRIEVTAVPPPAPRAPKAPDRSVSLDAYLNRRTGRAR